MATFTAPIREINFVLNDVLNVAQLNKFEAYADATPDIIEGVLAEAGRQVEEQIAPLSQPGDQQGARWDNGEVTMPDGVKAAYTDWRENGWVGLAADPEWGGQGLPYILSKAVEDILCAGNVSFALTPGLTQGCFDGIEASSTDELKQKYLTMLANGEWGGAMGMTEPSAGSDVGAVRTKAEPNDDGSYAITGSKIFITSGEHGLTDNIIHFVLARLPDAPAGVRGLSTFIIPKFLVNDDGSIGERNAVTCTAIEEKMGIHASATCSLAFDGAKGWLAGAPHTGIQNMFVMMNKARIMVGMQGLGQCELATQNAIAYAKDRIQGAPLGGGDDVAIIEHPDVRRMVMSMKAITEGARVMAYETSMAEDIAKHHPDEAEREAAQDWVELGTPLTKAFCTDQAVELGSMAIQVYGGHGFIAEHGIEQIVRDSKILCLYEGTNGIQSMDLVRRKIKMKGGALPKQFFSRVQASIDAAGDDAQVIAAPLAEALKTLQDTTAWLLEQFNTQPENAGAGAVPYLRAFSLVYLGWNWLRMVEAVVGRDDDFATAKRVTGKFFATRMLPEVASLCTTVRQDASDWMGLTAEQI